MYLSYLASPVPDPGAGQPFFSEDEDVPQLAAGVALLLAGSSCSEVSGLGSSECSVLRECGCMTDI